MVKQLYGSYTESDHQVWSSLYSRVMQFLPETADKAVVEGIKKIAFPSDHVPDFEEINAKLSGFTDWKIIPLDEMVDDKEFIKLLAHKTYPCRTGLRTPEEVLTEEDEYDLFHDVIGHTPLLTIPNYCNYLHQLGKMAYDNLNNDDITLYLKRIYWHTIQFGLKQEGNMLKVYGAHMISSGNETLFALGAGVPKYDLNISKVMDTPYVKNKFQERYFVVKNYDELYNSLDEIKSELEKRIKK